ncbi:MAG: SIS domain-containing protein [Pseudomonadota bacterium]
MSHATTRMAQEASETPMRVADQLNKNASIVAKIADNLKQFDPALIVTCARGSSDHAATYVKYLFETRLRLPVASFAPSVSSVYDVTVRLERAVFVAISQSGQSPDLLKSTEAALTAGAYVIALVNDASSPLAALANDVLPLEMGPETSVAATKSCLGSMTAAYQLCAACAESNVMDDALRALPEAFFETLNSNWTAAAPAFTEASQALIVSRGLGFAAAQEAALKLKETSQLQAEAFSTAEVRHGPMAIVGPHIPIIAAATGDAATGSIEDIARHFATLGAPVFLASPEEITGSDMPAGVRYLPTPHAPESALQPLVFLLTFYMFANKLAVARGLDPDNPTGLRKVTETV